MIAEVQSNFNYLIMKKIVKIKKSRSFVYLEQQKNDEISEKVKFDLMTQQLFYFIPSSTFRQMRGLPYILAMGHELGIM